MKKIVNQRFNETYNIEVLANGLNVVIWEKPAFNSSFAIFATPFGAFNLIEKVGEEEITYHSGIAHFLEHKMFESVDRHDVMEDFTRLGCNINAFTSYQETAYHFSTTRDDISEPLNLLLDFVQDFSVSEESVEKEKGIILQEYKMYFQMPDSRIVNEAFKALYHHFPLNQDISGDEENILAITKEELEAAHRINYHPSNMFLVVVTNKKAEDILTIVKENQAKKEFPEMPKIEKIFLEEPHHVVKDHKIINMQLQQPKIAMGYKFFPKTTDMREAYKIGYLLKLWLIANFTSINPDYQKWRDLGLINDSFFVESEYNVDVAFILMIADKLSEDTTSVIDEYLKQSLHKPFSEDVLKQLKNRLIGSIIRDYDSMTYMAISMINLHWQGLAISDVVEILESIRVEDFKQLIDLVDFNNRVIVEVN